MADHPHDHGHDDHGGLEAEVSNTESKSFMDKAFNLGYQAAFAVGTTALGLATVGWAAPAVAGAVAAGIAIGGAIKGEKSAYDIAIDALSGYSTINAILYPVIAFGDLTYPLIDNSDMFGKGLRTLYAMTAHTVVFQALNDPVQYLIKNQLNPKGLGTYLDTTFAENVKRTAVGFSPGWALAANGVTSLAGAPVFALNALPFTAYNQLYPVKPNLPEKQQKQEAAHPAHPTLAHAPGH